MDIKFNIFISHDSSDQAIAIELKGFLENLFLNSNVYVSGRDLEGGQTWIENIKLALSSSQVIIALISKISVNSSWLYFESGAGFTNDRTIPLITDNLQFKDLTPPLSLLQSRLLDKTGIPLLITDICKKLSLREPTNLPTLTNVLDRITTIISDRDKQTTAKVSSSAQPQKKLIYHAVTIDPKIERAFLKLNDRTKNAVIKKLMAISDKYEIPSEDELQKKSVYDLCNIATAYNVPIPGVAQLRLLHSSLGLPSETDEDWRKVSVLKGFDMANSELDKYEATP
ncbi:MAG: toll/interleukin-1 receptor domain-containing protein [Bacteroidota bacterium]